MSEGIEDINALTLYEQLDKWDKTHLPKLENYDLIRKVAKKISQKFDGDQFRTIRFQQSLSRNLNNLKATTKNEKIINKTIKKKINNNR